VIMKFQIHLDIDVDDTMSIDAMRGAILDDVKDWLASAPVMGQLASAADALAPAKAQFAAFEAIKHDQD